MVKKACLEDRSGEFTGQRTASGLLDYQDSAVKFLSKNLANPGERALLALDTGLGKSAVVKAVVDHHWKQMGLRCIVIVPSTLVDQTVKTLIFWPWEKPPQILDGQHCKSKKKFLADKGLVIIRGQQDLRSFVATPPDSRARLVVFNAACRQHLSNSFSALLSDRGLVVVEEAYSPSHSSTYPHRAALPDSRILFVTATPERLLKQEAKRANKNNVLASFLVKKTPRLLGSLGMSAPRLELMKLDTEAASMFATGCFGHGMQLPSHVFHVLDDQHIIPFLERQDPNYLHFWRAELIQNLRQEERSLLQANFGEPAGDLLDRHNWQNRDVMQSLKAMAAVPGRLKNFLFAAAKICAARRGQDVCECCALTETLLSRLAKMYHLVSHKDSVQLIAGLLREVLLPREHDLELGRFGATIVRCWSPETMEKNLIQELGVSSPFEFHKLSTSLVSKQRTKVIQGYMSFGGDRAAMCVLRRGRDQLYAHGNPLGRPHILALVSHFVTRHHVLPADGSIDVGIESLHRCTDSVVLQQLPASYAQLLQLGGRVSRLALDLKKPQPPIVVRCPLRIGTVEELLARHLQGEAKRQREGRAAGESHKRKLVPEKPTRRKTNKRLK